MLLRSRQAIGTVCVSLAIVTSYLTGNYFGADLDDVIEDCKNGVCGDFESEMDNVDGQLMDWTLNGVQVWLASVDWSWLSIMDWTNLTIPYTELNVADSLVTSAEYFMANLALPLFILVEILFFQSTMAAMVSSNADKKDAEFGIFRKNTVKTMKKIQSLIENLNELQKNRDEKMADIWEVVSNLEGKVGEFDESAKRLEESVIQMRTEEENRKKKRPKKIQIENPNLKVVGTMTRIPVFTNSPRPVCNSERLKHLFEDCGDCFDANTKSVDDVSTTETV